MKRLIVTIFVLQSFIGLSQQSEFNFSFYDPKINLYVIGEDHFNDNSELQLSILNYLQNNTDVTSLVLEVPVEVGKIMNDYVLNGTKEKQLKNIIRLFNSYAQRNVFSLLNYIRVYNEQKMENQKIQVQGIDMMSFDTYKNQLKSLLYLFPEFNESDIPMIEKYLKNLEKNKVKKKNRKKIFDLLLDDLETNNKLYEKCLKSRLEIYKTQLIEIKYNYLESWKQQDSVRESILTKNLVKEIDTTKVKLLICGASHALSLKNDTWYFGYPYTTMVASAKLIYPNRIFSIITQYYEKKLYRFFDEFTLLSVPTKSYFIDRTLKYAIIENLEPHPEARKRCDMIVIQNTRWKPK